MKQPLAIDLFCGLGGWTEGLLAEGYRVVGFDVERHVYGEAKYPAQLVLQDVLTLHGSQFKTADLIVASPPCQEFSYMAMPWSKAKTIAREYLDGTRDRARLTALFDACFRIQREASIAAGRHIPLVVENVCGAQKWVGRARWHYGSFYLWGDVPALMPNVRKHVKVDGFRFDGSGRSFQSASVEGTKVPTMGAGWYPPDHPKHVAGFAFNGHADRFIKGEEGLSRGRRFDQRPASNPLVHRIACSFVGGSIDGAPEWCDRCGRRYDDPCHSEKSKRRTAPGNGVRFTSRDCGIERKNGGDWFGGGLDCSLQRRASSKSSARKAASAQIAKIPPTLSRHIARVWHPEASHG